MKTLVESLKRLYESGRITREQVAKRAEKGSITAEEYEEITDEPLRPLW